MNAIIYLNRFLPAFFGFWLLVFSAHAEDRVKFNYIDPKGIPLQELLGNPPADDSAKTKAEIEEILEWQRTRTVDQVARARSEAQLTPYIFADVLGPWFKPGNLPATDALLQKVQTDVRSIIDQGKDVWNRPRPRILDSRVKPVIEIAASSAYPSGHAVNGTCFGRILEELAPKYRQRILERAELIGLDRVIASVHYSSDIVAGNKLGGYVADRLLENPGFQADIIKAREEIQSFLH